MKKGIRLSKALARAGVAARRPCEELIFQGRVKVNGQVVLLPQTLVEDKDVLQVDNKKIKAKPKLVYYLLNKPVGYLCTHTRPHETSKLVLDLFADLPYRLFTVGRLDRDTTGLLLITNDGHMANRIIHPSFNVQKEYLAKTVEEISPEHLKIISQGTFIEGAKVRPISVAKVRRGTIKIVVGEGKKREVRQLLEHAGLTVKDLARIRLGPLTLGKLPIGSWKELTFEELDQLFN